jgi:hypothetical protein
MTPFGKIGGVGASQLISQLGLEVDKMGDELAQAFGDMKGTLGGLSQAFQQATQGAGSALGLPAVQGQIGGLARKILFIAVLQAAIEKAGKNRHFNIETAINDLWISLDPVRKMGAAGDAQGLPAVQRSAAIDVEMQKLQRMIQKRSQMFDMLRGIMEKYDATAKGVIQSMGR